MANEKIGMAQLPELARGIEANVVANRLELPRIEGEIQPRAPLEDYGTTGAGRPEPRHLAFGLWRSGFAASLRHLIAMRQLRGNISAAIYRRDQFGYDIRGFEAIRNCSDLRLFRGFGGLPPVVPSRFDGIEQTMRSPKRVEPGRAQKIDDHEKMNVVGHDHEIGDADLWPYLMNRQKRGLYIFAQRQQLWPRFLIDQIRQNRLSACNREGYEEKLYAVSMNVEAHWKTAAVSGGAA